MTETTETPKAIIPKPGDVAKKGQVELEKVRKEFEAKAKISKLLIEAKKAFKDGKNVEALKKFSIFVVALFAKKLKDLKSDVEEKRKKAEQQKAAGKKSKPTTKGRGKEDDKKKDVAPNKKSAPAKKAAPKAKPFAESRKKLAKGELFPTLALAFPKVEIKKKLVGLDHKTIEISGKPGWEKGHRTGKWDYEKAGNTDATISKGEYKVDSVLPPPGYSRLKVDIDKIQDHKKHDTKEVHDLLTAICVKLNNDSRMPLFTGIAVKITDKKGKTYEAMCVKEIHCWKTGTTDSTYRLQPHTGVSYIIKT